jgi:hypothetical protein
MEDDPNFVMEDDLNFFNRIQPQFWGNGRQSQFVWKWKMTSICLKMEDDLNLFENGRGPHFFGKWKTTTTFKEMEDDLKYFFK